MRVCSACQSANSDDARFCIRCGVTMSPVQNVQSKLGVPSVSLVLGAIGFMIWGIGNLPWAINPSYLYNHLAIVKVAYVAWAVGPVLVAIGLLVAGQSISRRVGGGSAGLAIVGLMLIGITQLPYVFSPNSSISYRLEYGGPVVGFVLLGIGVLVAIPKVAAK